MCYLIHVGVPAKHAGAVKTQRLPRVDPHQNPSVSAAFGPSFVTFAVTDGNCSCHLYSTPEAPDDGRAAERDRRKYERLGWSAAKIARALAASAEATTHRRGGVRGDVAELVANLAAAAGEVRLIVHTYRGSFGDEHVESQGTHELRASELRSAAIGQDIVYVIRP